MAAQVNENIATARPLTLEGAAEVVTEALQIGPRRTRVKLNLGAGAHPLPGFVNLDKSTGWRFEDGLADHGDGSVAGITISHALMYVRLADWPLVFAEFARVLERGGVVRITEDATDDPRSSRYGGFHDAVTLTSASLVSEHLDRADLHAEIVHEHFSHFRFKNERSLIQRFHGASPKVFHVEGLKR